MFSVAAVSMCGKILGSVQRVILDSALWLRRAGVCDTFMANMVLPSNAADYAFLKECRDAGFGFETLVTPHQLSFHAVHRLAQLASERGIPILHSHGYKSNVHCLLAARRAGCRWISTLHMWTEHNMRDRIYTKIDQILLRYADGCITVSEASKSRAVGVGVPEKKITVVYNWIDAHEYVTKANEYTPSDLLSVRREKEIVLLVAGRLSYEKGHLLLLEALKDIPRCESRWTCLLAGDGPLRNDIERKIQDYNLTDTVRLVGYRSDLPGVMQIADWVVLPSYREGFPLVLLEAFALSKPVVATNVGGVSELVVHGVNGWLVPPRDINALKNAIIRAICLDPQERRAMGEAGRTMVEENFSPDVQIPKIGQLYQQVISGKHR